MSTTASINISYKVSINVNYDGYPSNILNLMRKIYEGGDLSNSAAIEIFMRDYSENTRHMIRVSEGKQETLSEWEYTIDENNVLTTECHGYMNNVEFDGLCSPFETVKCMTLDYQKEEESLIRKGLNGLHCFGITLSEDCKMKEVTESLTL